MYVKLSEDKDFFVIISLQTFAYLKLLKDYVQMCCSSLIFFPSKFSKTF